MLTFSLQSGSNGNCIYVEAGDVRLLFDAGISGKQAALRMAAHGREIRDCTALIISHDHSDHARGAGVFHRRFGIPVYMNEKVYRAVRPHTGSIDRFHPYTPGQTLDFGDVRVHTIKTPHDGIETACFLIEHGGRCLGIFTDLGHPFPQLAEALAQVHAAYLESNYDSVMLWNGAYTEATKKRIVGDGGHLSNDEAADLTRRSALGHLRWLALAHLSEENNHPELALETHRRQIGNQLPLLVASRYQVSEVLDV